MQSTYLSLYLGLRNDRLTLNIYTGMRKEIIMTSGRMQFMCISMNSANTIGFVVEMQCRSEGENESQQNASVKNATIFYNSFRDAIKRTA